jgi:hypothetical protein
MCEIKVKNYLVAHLPRKGFGVPFHKPTIYGALGIDHISDFIYALAGLCGVNIVRVLGAD